MNILVSFVKLTEGSNKQRARSALVPLYRAHFLKLFYAIKNSALKICQKYSYPINKHIV
jgi:hypothetical protein